MYGGRSSGRASARCEGLNLAQTFLPHLRAEHKQASLICAAVQAACFVAAFEENPICSATPSMATWIMRS